MKKPLIFIRLWILKLRTNTIKSIKIQSKTGFAPKQSPIFFDFKSKAKLIFQVLLLLATLNLDSQTTSLLPDKQTINHGECGSTLLLKNNLIQNIGLANQLNANAAVTTTIASNSPPLSPFIIPVVFHVITDPNNATVAPNYAQIQMQLASLNAAFSNSLNSLNNVPAGAQAVNTQIQFCFAKKRWINNAQAAWPSASVGVVYHSVTNSITTNVNINNNASLASLSALTNAQYPPGMYLNIWCVPNIATSANTSVNAPPGVVGIGTFPWMTMPIDGIVMRNDCIGNNTYNNFSGTMFPPLDKGNILAHEVGHYLGLFHTFETITGSNINTVGGPVNCYGLANPTAEGDLIFDTPPTKINGQVPPGSYNTCNESYFPYGPLPGADVNDQIENFMSYSDDDYMNTFTNKQGERMWGALDNVWATTFLTGQRAGLVSSANLTNTGVNLAPSCGPGLLTANFTSSLMATSITCTSSAVKFLQPVMPGYLSANTFTWYFGDGNTSTALNPVHTYTVAPYIFTATLVVSNGSSTISSTLTINIPSGVPQIVGWSGQNIPVCRGTEQTILINFPANILTAVLTDGTTSYVVNNNFVHNLGPYNFPFTFSITSSGNWSLSLGNCNTSTTVASFTVIDCCSNLVYNGDFEAGPVGFTSQYNLTNNNYSSGSAAINLSFGQFINEMHQTGQQLMIDASGTSGCSNPAIQTLLIGQTITGLQPTTNYYVSFKSNQSVDSTYYLCANKFSLRFFCSAAPGLLNQTIRPSNVPPPPQVVSNSGANGFGSKQVHSFMVTTPPTINAATVFSLELYEFDNRYSLGFDYTFDNFIVARMNGALAINPSITTVSACQSSTVQLNAISNCSNIANYNLVWQPSANLSCNTCVNPIATVSATTIFTLIAIPPITTPPSPNVVITSTVFVNGSSGLLVVSPSSSTVSACPSSTIQLNALSSCSNVANYSLAWQPSANLSCNTCVNPIATVSATTIFTLIATPPITNPPSSNVVITSTVFAFGPPPMNITTLTLAPCYPPSYSLSVGNAITATWQPGNTASLNVVVSPTMSTTYTVIANMLSNSLTCFSQSLVSISVPAIPTITATAQSVKICRGEPVKLNGFGALTYTWSTSQTGSVVNVSPIQTTTYTVQGMVNGCPSKTASVTVTVLPCAGVNELAESREVFNVYPNPNTGQFTIQADTEIELKLFNALGQLIRNLKLETLNNYKADVVDLSSGVYLISGKKNNKYYNIKVVVTE